MCVCGPCNDDNSRSSSASISDSGLVRRREPRAAADRQNAQLHTHSTAHKRQKFSPSVRLVDYVLHIAASLPMLKFGIMDERRAPRTSENCRNFPLLFLPPYCSFEWRSRAPAGETSYSTRTHFSAQWDDEGRNWQRPETSPWGSP